MTVAVLRYNAGNIQSIAYALDRLGITYALTSDPEEITKADKVIFPGVGEASTTMNFLKQARLHELIPTLAQPILGICLGMQLLCKHSEENDTECLGIFDLPVNAFIPSDSCKIPHMGWNALDKTSNWLGELEKDSHVYFAHSYYVPLNQYTVAESEHTLRFSAALKKDNFYTVQFHPEKSGDVGTKVLNAFLEV